MILKFEIIIKKKKIPFFNPVTATGQEVLTERESATGQISQHVVRTVFLDFMVFNKQLWPL